MCVIPSDEAAHSRPHSFGRRVCTHRSSGTLSRRRNALNHTGTRCRQSAHPMPARCSKLDPRGRSDANSGARNRLMSLSPWFGDQQPAGHRGRRDPRPGLQRYRCPGRRERPAGRRPFRPQGHLNGRSPARGPHPRWPLQRLPRSQRCGDQLSKAKWLNDWRPDRFHEQAVPVAPCAVQPHEASPQALREGGRLLRCAL